MRVQNFPSDDVVVTLPKETINALHLLVEENRLLREAIENTPVPFGVFDQETRLIAHSKAFTRIHPHLNMIIAQSDSPVTFAQIIRRALEDQVSEDRLDHAIAERVREFISSDGTPMDRYYPELGWFRLIRYRHPSGAVSGLAFDISELKEREQDLRRARSVAEESERLRAEFLANMSHEIRTPMNGVLGMAELLRNTELDDRQQMFADTIVRSGQDLMRIINDVLDVAKIEAGGLELDPAPFDPTEAIEDVIALMSGKAAEKGLNLAVQFIGDLPAQVIGDGARLRQILSNLIGNAIKFTQTGHVLVRAISEDQSRDGVGHSMDLTIEVEDTGCGIAETHHNLIFQKFEQADTGGTIRQEGTGLGLAITHALVTLMGGKIGLDSAEGQGATFRVQIELAIDRQSEGLSDPTDTDVSGARILIVDDNPINRKILTEQMKHWNFDPLVTSTGPQALEMITHMWRAGTPLDLAIIDHRMPEMPGDDLLRHMHLLPGNNLPVIMLTSIDMPNAWEKYANLGLAACLAKPPRSSQLYNAIVSAITQLRDPHPDTIAINQ